MKKLLTLKSPYKMHEEKDYTELFVKYPQMCTLETVLNNNIKKSKHILKHFEKDEFNEMIKHLQWQHSLIEDTLKMFMKKD